MKKNGFTIVEIVIAITISVIVLSGVLMFLTKLQEDILTSEQSTRVYTSMSDFIATMKNFSKLYESGSIVINTASGYDSVLLMKADKSSGVLIGVVNQSATGSASRLDGESNFDTYGKKVIAYQRVNSGSISSILASPSNAYNIDFFNEGLFKNLPASSFWVTSYNSGSILEYKINIEVPYYDELKGKSRSSIGENTVKSLPFTLNF